MLDQPQLRQSSGLGATPVTLVNAATDNQTEITVNNQTDNANPVIATDAGLPVDSLTATLNDTTSKPLNAAPVTVAPAPKAKTARAANHHEFVANDFTYANNNTVITGFSDSFMTSTYANWDGNLVFPALPGVTMVGSLDTSGMDSDPTYNGIFKGFSGTQNGYKNKLDTIATIDLSRLTNLQTIGDFAFYNLDNLTSVKVTGLSQLTTIGNRAFQDCHYLSPIDFDDIPGLVSIGNYAFANCGYFNYNAPSITIDFRLLPHLQSIGDYAFGSWLYLENMYFGPQLPLTSIGRGAFSGTGLLTVDLTPLNNLESIGEWAFSGCNNLLTFKFPNPSKITAIQPHTFTYNNLQNVDLSGLTELKSIDYEAFNSAAFVNLTISSLHKLQSISQRPFSETSELETLTLSDLPALTFLEGGFGGTESFTTLNLFDLPLLATVVDSFSGPQLKNINVRNVNPDVDITNEFSGVGRGGTVTPLDTDSLAIAQKIVDTINRNNRFTGNDMWSIASTVTYKYVDQDNNPITVDSKNKPVKPISLTGRVDDAYEIPDAPTISGYGDPVLVSPVATGSFTFPAQVVTFQYRALSLPFTVSLVDTAGNELKTIHYDGYADEEVDLTPELINGYDFTELLSQPTTNTLRVGTDITWLHDERVGQTLKYGANNGRNYKFVYTKKAAVPDNDSDNQPTNGTNGTNGANGTDGAPGANGNTGDTGANGNAGTDGKTGTDGNAGVDGNPGVDGNAGTSQTPADLPSTGGDNPVVGTNTPLPTATVATYPPYHAVPLANSNQDTKLPQSGNVKNYLLPAIGSVLIIGLAGLYAFTKKRKS